MKEQKKLTIGMAIFSFFIFVCFGIIIVTEKSAPYFSFKIDQKFNSYLKENYTSIINELKIDNTNYENTIYRLKVTSNRNKNLYFYLKYSNKRITDTYQEDYKEGKTLLTKISTNLEKSLAKKYNKAFSITILTTLDKFSEQVKEKILQEEISSLPIYSLDTKIQTDFTVQSNEYSPEQALNCPLDNFLSSKAGYLTQAMLCCSCSFKYICSYSASCLP